MKAVPTVSCLLWLLIAIAPVPASADSLLVLKSNAQGWRQGTTIDGAAVVTLVDGEQLTLVSGSGREILISGPYAGSPLPTETEPGGEGLIHSLAPLFTDKSKDETVIGAYRTPVDDREALAWTIDADVLGEEATIVCLDENKTLSVARPDGVDKAKVILESFGSASRAEMSFSDSADTVPWPDTVAAEDNARYRLMLDDGTTVAEFVIALLPTGLPTPAHRAAWMADRGCRLQARRLMLVSY